MAIAILDATVTGTQLTGTSPLTISYTVTAGASVLVVTAGVDSSSDRNPTATWNGVSMGAAVAEALGAAGGQGAAIFVIANPDSGTHDVVISTDFISSSDYILGTVRTYSGVDTTTPTSGGTSTTAGAANSISLNVSSATGDLVVDAVSVNAAITNLTVGASQTERANFNYDGAANGTHHGTSEEAGATTTTMSWSWTTNSSRIGIAGVNLKAAGGAAPNIDFAGTKNPQLLTLGVG